MSLVLATWARDYIGGLEATRYRGPAASKAAHDGLNTWVARFAPATRRAVDDASRFEAVAAAILDGWRARLGPVRAGSATDRLLRALPGAPLVTVSSAAVLADRSFAAANDATARLEAAGIVRQVSVGRRNRAFEVPEIIEAFTDLERQLASPEGSTRASPPARRVPRRR
jgi:hypothetical protein